MGLSYEPNFTDQPLGQKRTGIQMICCMENGSRYQRDSEICIRPSDTGSRIVIYAKDVRCNLRFIKAFPKNLFPTTI